MYTSGWNIGLWFKHIGINYFFQDDNMPSGVERTSGRLPTTPVSERQQLALLKQMTSPKSGLSI